MSVVFNRRRSLMRIFMDFYRVSDPYYCTYLLYITIFDKYTDTLAIKQHFNHPHSYNRDDCCIDLNKRLSAIKFLGSVSVEDG